MVAAIPQAAASTDKSALTPARPPLLPDQQQQNGSRIASTRKPRGKQVSSRYLSPSPSSSTTTTSTNTTSSSSSSTTTTTTTSSSFSRRCPSPLFSRSTNSSLPNTQITPKRSQSVDRKRPVASAAQSPGLYHANASELSAATKMLITSTRSLSVSFQGEAFSLPISKAKAKAMSQQNVDRKMTPERRRATPVRDQVENSRPGEQHRWPGRSREGNSRNVLLSRSLDCSIGGGDKRNVTGSGFEGIKSLHQSIMVVGGDESGSVRRLSLDSRNVSEVVNAKNINPQGGLGNEYTSPGDLNVSDSDSVSSGGTSGVLEFGGGGRTSGASRGVAVSARFWRETNSRLRRLQDPGSPLSASPGSRVSVCSKTKRFSIDCPALVSPRTAASPIRGATRAASPGKLWTHCASSPSRGYSSPSRVRPNSGNSTSTPSILSFSVDLRRGKIGEDRIADAHTLRLLYNHHLQWRFVNARADATFTVQRGHAEKNVWNAWVTISELRHSVTLRRIKLILLRQKLKLTSILKRQISCLEEWSYLDRDHCNSLEEATEALKASTLRLPVVGKATVDVQNLKDAIGSAVDIMQSMVSSIWLQSPKVEEMNSLVAEIVNVTTKERVMLHQCKDLLSILAAMQVKYCSLRTHIVQSNGLATSTTLTTRV